MRVEVYFHAIQITLIDYALNRFLFIFLHPKSVESLNVFLSPYDLTVWLGIFTLAAFSALIVRQLFLIENHQIVTKSIKSDDINENSYSNSTLMIFGFIFQQGKKNRDLERGKPLTKI